MFEDMQRAVMHAMQAIADMAQHTDALRYEKVVRVLAQTQGLIAVTGIGKAGLVAKKSVATLQSYSIRSVFVHPQEAMHGDLGLLGAHDTLVCVSNSGKTQEVIQMLRRSTLRVRTTVALVGDLESPLAIEADYALCFGKVNEACFLQLAPTTSSVCLMLLMDTLAMSLAKLRGTDKRDFEYAHPGGSIGVELGAVPSARGGDADE